MKKLIITTFLIILVSPIFSQNDAENCEDHPLISRFPNATIEWCETQEFGAYHIAVGPQTGYRKIDKWVDIEGKIERLYYVISDGSTVNEVYQNYRNSIQKAGFEVLAKGIFPQSNVKKEVGGNTWVATAYAKNLYPTNSNVQLFHGTSESAGKGYIAGKLARPTGNTFLVLTAYQHRSSEILVALDVIEEAPLEDGQVTVDVDYIAREIEANGTVSLYGIYFDFDKSDIKPESNETLKIIADYLKKYPKINLYIIGHTDMKGTLTYNLTLSEKRATAVVDNLVSRFGISRSRLEGKGVGPLSPKSNNTSEVGRKLNRRVELVRKL